MGLHKIVYEEMEELFEVFNDIKFFRNIDNAFGKTLDFIGSNVQQLRGVNQDDEQYRLLIKIKIIANLSKGDIETINSVATALIGDSFKGIKEAWNLSEYDNEPAALVLLMENQAVLLEASTIDQAIAGGVGIRYILELVQPEPTFYVIASLLAGEDTTIYPYHPKDLESKGHIFIPIGNRADVDSTIILPKGSD